MIETLAIAISLFFLLALDLVAIGARTSFLQVTHGRLLAQRETLGEQVNAAVNLLSVMPRLRASLNLTLIFTRFGLAALVLALVQLRVVTYPVIAAILGLCLAALLLFWFEWAVERMALRSAETWATRLATFARVLMASVSLLIVPLSASNGAQNPPESPVSVTEDELKTLVDAGEQEGLLQMGERRMIHSIFELGDTLAREIMVPRIDMLALDVATPLTEAVDAILRAGFSRVPIYEETVDNTLGLLYAKDLLRAWREENQLSSLRDLLRPAYFVPEGKKVDELLAEMQSQRIHMAIVVDEYGGVAGLVTLEDIVEEIFGEILDEYDQGEEAPYQKLADGGYLFLGRIGLDDFNEIMGSNLTSEDADTLGGYIYGRLGHVPNIGETVQEGNLLLVVEQVAARRIRKVSARWIAKETQEEEDQERVDG